VFTATSLDPWKEDIGISFGHLLLKTFRRTYADHRDWPDIDASADGIARQL